jgi:hypothetical protein
MLLTVAAGAVLAASSLLVVHRGAVGGRGDAIRLGREGLEALGFSPHGDVDAELETDQDVVWALERARPGPAGAALGRGQGGGVLWRVRFSDGGEAVVTSGGLVWAVRRPVPVDPGKDLFAYVASASLLAQLPRLVHDPAAWRIIRFQSWGEAGHVWYRARLVGGEGELPVGWRRELELEQVGSTLVSWRRFARPLGTDLGVVMGRVAELKVMRQPAVLGIGIAFLAVLLAGAEAYAFHQRVRITLGVASAGAVLALAWLAGAPRGEAMAMALVSAASLALLPLWTALPPGRSRRGAVAGGLIALLVASVPRLVQGMGGWMPQTPAFPPDTSPVRLFASSWLPALGEEPLLRGALPALTASTLGWWGGALLGAGFGVLLHPVPGVPMVAALGGGLLLQLGMVLACRVGGLGAAVLARGTCEALVRRIVYPVGPVWDQVALFGAALGLILLIWAPRSE